MQQQAEIIQNHKMNMFAVYKAKPDTENTAQEA
jgi:hypothetical protein